MAASPEYDLDPDVLGIAVFSRYGNNQRGAEVFARFAVGMRHAGIEVDGVASLQVIALPPNRDYECAGGQIQKLRPSVSVRLQFFLRDPLKFRVIGVEFPGCRSVVESFEKI